MRISIPLLCGLAALMSQGPARGAPPGQETQRAAHVQPALRFDTPEPGEALQGGRAGVPAQAGPAAFSQLSAGLDPDRALDFLVGKGLFDRSWQVAPGPAPYADGLGPLYNAPACQACHVRDGRGRPPRGPGDAAPALVLRVGVPQADGPAEPDPVYGRQIQTRAIGGVPPEARLSVTHTEEIVALSGGESATLRRPHYALRDPGYGPLHPRAVLSPRIAPQLIGLGLLEAIPQDAIRARADPGDADADGISGRVQHAPSGAGGAVVTGRFGLKAAQPSVRAHSAAALARDMGMSSPPHPDGFGTCTPAQTACRTAPDGAEMQTEIGADGLRLLSFYTAQLAVPARRDVDDPQVLRGKAVFYQTGCTACHTPKFVIPPARPQDDAELIWPYTDLLLHDMGPGLADGLAEGRASGAEWRTPPLWGIGLTRQVSGHSHFLHDGRARSLLEAVLWHGGEAAPHSQAVIDMPPADRAALVRFLESL